MHICSVTNPHNALLTNRYISNQSKQIFSFRNTDPRPAHFSVISLTPKEKLIFVVEDNKLYSFLLDYKLHLNTEYTFISFSEGDECIESLIMKPDVIVLDQDLPGINCLEVLKKIKAFNKDIQVIVLASSDEKESRTNVLKYGAYDYFVKGKDSAKEIDRLISKIFDSIQIRNKEKLYHFWTKAGITFIFLALEIIILYQILGKDGN